MNKRGWIYSYVLLVVGGSGIGIQSVFYFHQLPTFSTFSLITSICSIALGVILSSKTAFR
jgi:hypothetical protein